MPPLQALPVPVAGGIDRPYLFLSGHPRARSRVCLFGLHFQDCAEQLLRGDRQEANLRVGVQAVQVRTLGGKVLIDVLMVALGKAVYKLMVPAGF